MRSAKHRRRAVIELREKPENIEQGGDCENSGKCNHGSMEKVEIVIIIVENSE